MYTKVISTAHVDLLVDQKFTFGFDLGKKQTPASDRTIPAIQSI